MANFSPALRNQSTYASLVAVTPSDSVDLTGTARALWVGGAGNVSLIAAGDSSPITLNSVAAGTLLPIAVKRVRSTSTTATNIVALY